MNFAALASADIVPPGRFPGLSAAQYQRNNAVHNIRDYGARGGASDDGWAIQAAINAAQSDSEFATGIVEMPPGRYPCHAPLAYSKQYVHMRGAGMNGTELLFDFPAGAGSGASLIATAPGLMYLRPVLTDFRVTAAAGTTGVGIDFSNISPTPGGQMYNGEFSRLWINTKGACIYGERVFSFLFSHLYGQSANDHTFKVHCGNSVLWSNCYAVSCPMNKAGYRLSGAALLVACNGLSSGGWWAIFGQDTGAADGFQADFPNVGMSYPDVHLENCNIEDFTTGGVKFHAEYVRAYISGKIDRNSLTSAYHSIVHARKRGYVNGAAIKLNVRVFPGSGTPNGGAAFTDAHLLTDGPAIFEDQAGTLYDGVPAITKWRNTTDGIPYPIHREKYKSDVYGDNALWHDALSARRITVEMMRYAEGALAPAAAPNQTIDVTGYTKVIVTPAGSCSLDRATFSATPGTGTPNDFGRNGDLIIEAGLGATVTINHNYDGADGFRLKGGVSTRVLSQGDIARFVRSQNYRLGGVPGWIEV
jgi:hypothetical protein